MTDTTIKDQLRSSKTVPSFEAAIATLQGTAQMRAADARTAAVKFTENEQRISDLRANLAAAEHNAPALREAAEVTQAASQEADKELGDMVTIFEAVQDLFAPAPEPPADALGHLVANGNPQTAAMPAVQSGGNR